MNQNGLGGNPSQNPKIQSFLEALRASRGASGKANGAENGIAKFNPFGEFQARKETEQRRIELFHQARNQEWNKVYSSKEHELSQKVEEIRAQLKKFAKQAKVLDKNIVRALESPIVQYGQADITFLEHLKKSIDLWQKSAHSANTWLESFNQRVMQKGFYHQMASKKGTSYTQNNERVIATSVG